MRGHCRDNIKATFNNVGKIKRPDARVKRYKQTIQDRIIFSTKYNPRGPNISKIIKENLHLLQNHDLLKEIFPKGSILVANKREHNLKDLLLRSDPYNIKNDIMDNNLFG